MKTEAKRTLPRNDKNPILLLMVWTLLTLQAGQYPRREGRLNEEDDYFIDFNSQFITINNVGRGEALKLFFFPSFLFSQS